MKKTMISVLAVLAAALFISVMPTEAEAQIYSDTVRLHILANSDSDEDQALKLKVRDRLLVTYGERLGACASREAAESNIRTLLPEMQSCAEEVIAECGFDYSVTASITTEWYDTREYEDFTLPKGYYSSLRIIIGSGEGRNWWCVMYPPLCLDMALEDAPPDDAIVDYTREEYALISSSGYNVKFKLLELIADAIDKFQKNN